MLILRHPSSVSRLYLPAMPAYIHAPIPGHLLNTACGNLLAQRLIREEWVEPPWERSREKWAMALYRDSPDADKLKFQTNLKIKKSSPVVDRLCNSCLQPLTKKSALKCAVCLETRYCSKGCQISDWAEHKKNCVPPKPKIATHGAIHLPEHYCTRAYMSWFNSSSPAGRPPIGVIMTSAEAFIEWHGVYTYEKTLLSLAVKGYPEFVMMTESVNISV